MDGIKFEGRTINVKLKKSRKDVSPANKCQ